MQLKTFWHPSALVPSEKRFQPYVLNLLICNVNFCFRQELARLQEPSRSSNIEDLDNLLDDLNFVQKNYNPDRK